MVFLSFYFALLFFYFLFVCFRFHPFSHDFDSSKPQKLGRERLVLEQSGFDSVDLFFWDRESYTSVTQLDDIPRRDQVRCLTLFSRL